MYLTFYIKKGTNHFLLGGWDEFDILPKNQSIIKVKTPDKELDWLEVQKVTFDERTIGENLTATLDFGSTISSFPSSMLAEIKQFFEDIDLGCELYFTSSELFLQLGCSLKSREDMPDLRFHISGYVFILDHTKMIDVCSPKNPLSNKMNCLINLEFQSGGTQIVFGKTFLQYLSFGFFFDDLEIWMSMDNMISQQEFDLQMEEKMKKKEGG